MLMDAVCPDTDHVVLSAPMTVVLAIDAGTTSVRTIAFAADGSVVADAQREFTQYFPRPGWVEHDAEEIWQAVAVVLTEVATTARSLGHTIAGIGITDQRETIVAWDRETGRPVHRAIVWQDRRTASRCEQLELDGALPLVRSTTGLVLDPYFSGSKLEWLFTEGGVDRDRVKVGTVDTWLIDRLTDGTEHVTDVTNASRTMLFDITSLEWSPELCELFGVPLDALPTVVASSGRIALTADDSPVGGGVPISGIAGDQQASLFGEACFTPGMAKNTYGTGSFLLMNVGERCPDPVDGLLTTIAWGFGNSAGSITPTYAYEGAVFVSGSAVQWLRDGIGVIETSSDITALAESVSDTDGVVLVPAFTGLGSPWWDPRARGAVFGITRGTTRAHLARATIESIVMQATDVIEAMSGASGFPIVELRADGGGASDLVLQLQADALGVTIRRPVVAETTAFGAAALAGLAEEVWDSPARIAADWRSDAVFEPRPDDTLPSRRERWHRAVRRSLDWAED